MTSQAQPSVFGLREGYPERIDPDLATGPAGEEHELRYRWACAWVGGRDVLDVACGTGYGTPILQSAGSKSVVGVDVSEEAIRYGRSKYGLAGIRGDALELPFRPASFDIIVSLETIEHVARPELFLREINRVSRTGGRLAVTSPNRTLSTRANPHHIREFTRRELTSLLETSGFRVEAVWGQEWVFPLVWRLSKTARGLRGIRGIIWRIERRRGIRLKRTRDLAVKTSGLPGRRPISWCVLARKVG